MFWSAGWGGLFFLGHENPWSGFDPDPDRYGQMNMASKPWFYSAVSLA